MTISPERLCDRVAVLDHGRVLALDTVPNLVRQHGGATILVAEVDGAERRTETTDALAELNRLAAAATLGAFHVERPTLERVFLRLTGRQLRDCAAACFFTAAGIQVLVFTVGAMAFGVRPNSIALLALAILCACAAFVGIMMLLSVLGRTEQAVSGSAWAVVLVMSMIGGAWCRSSRCPGGCWRSVT